MTSRVKTRHVPIDQMWRMTYRPTSMSSNQLQKSLSVEGRGDSNTETLPRFASNG